MSEGPEHLLAIKLVGAKKATFLGGDTSGPFDATDYTRTDIVRAQIEAAVKRALEGAAEHLSMFAEPGVSLDYSFDDAWQGLPPRYDIDPPKGGGLDTNRVWAYERGRAFAVYCKAVGRGDPRPLKDGNRVPYYIVDLLQDAVQARYVI